jgi:hypothetical protein
MAAGWGGVVASKRFAMPSWQVVVAGHPPSDETCMILFLGMPELSLIGLCSCRFLLGSGTTVALCICSTNLFQRAVLLGVRDPSIHGVQKAAQDANAQAAARLTLTLTWW